MAAPSRRAGVSRLSWMLGAAVALASIAACEQHRAAAVADPDDEHWKLVRAYVDTDTAWHAKSREIAKSDATNEEKKRRREEERGEHPDITLAVGAAKAILAVADHPKFVAAAEFLMEHPRGVKNGSELMTAGAEALARYVGADWALVEAYRAADSEWRERKAEIAKDADTVEEKKDRERALGDRPKALRAIAAALAVIDAQGAANEEKLAAAEFLAREREITRVPNASAYRLRGASAILEHFPDYENWTELLGALDSGRFRADEKIDALIEQVGERAADPVVRATARYYLAKGLMRAADAFTTTDEDRASLRERALVAVDGLSEGVAEAELVDPRVVGDDGDPEARALADVEAAILHRIKHTTVGGTLPEVTAKRLDGTDESLDAYAGKVVLIDFWATWCGPCVGALPELRDMVEKWPSERFALLSISVDADLETVTEFQADEPMPWGNWHVGENSDLAELWDVRAFPTYVLVDGDGVILARTSHLSEAFTALIERRVGAPA